MTLATNITPLSLAIQTALQAKIDQKTKPLGSLGKLEALALKLGLIQETLSPTLKNPAIVIFAGDHGIAHAGVSAFPQAVTAQMVFNFLRGGAAINVFAKISGMQLKIVNSGVAEVISDFAGHKNFINTPIAQGTQNFTSQSAMSASQVQQALEAGAGVVRQLAVGGCNIIGFGEMGIANTSAAACIISRLTGLPLAQCVGRGTGVDDAGLAHKLAVLEAAMALHDTAQSSDGVLAAFGGFEIAMMTGAYLEAARQKMLIIVDGFIATSALLAASQIAPAVLDYCVYSHLSHEAGHLAVLAHLKAVPLLQLDLRLGEGTGAALAYPLVVAAAAFLNDMASFASAGVSEKSA
jgi:nicotinate-nucleotide--dimethylbenzimidazole phosphoribosyltransferase